MYLENLGRTSGLLAAMLALGLSRPARASVAEAGELDSYAARPLAVEGQLGLGSPLGGYGVAVDYTPIPWLSLNAGVGKALNGGTQLALTPRLRRPGSGMAFGMGLSTGSARYPEVICFFSCHTDSWQHVMWANPELSFEGRSRHGITFRLFGGVQLPVSAEDHGCSGDCLNGVRGFPPAMPYLGVAVGAALPRLR